MGFRSRFKTTSSLVPESKDELLLLIEAKTMILTTGISALRRMIKAFYKTSLKK